jgi:hypothetical protein
VSTRTGVDYAVLADVVREEILRAGYIDNSCILAARMAGIVLRQLGVSGVEAMACEVDVFSPSYVAMRKVAWELDRELTEAEADEFVAAGAWRVMLSFSEPAEGFVNNRAGRRGYNGHVVTLIDRAQMIDPTLPQVNRPERQLLVEPPFAWAIDYDAARTRGHVMTAANGTICVHRLVPGRKDFTRAPDWRLVPTADETIGRIMDRLTAE